MDKLNELLREYAQAIRRDDGTAFMHADAVREHFRLATAPTKPAEGQLEIWPERLSPKAFNAVSNLIVGGLGRNTGPHEVYAAIKANMALATATTMSQEIVGYLVDDPNEPDIGHWFDEGKPNRDLGLRARPLTFAAPTVSEAGRQLRLHVRRLLDFINNEGPAAKEWQAISETSERIGVLLAEIDRAAAKGDGRG